MERKTAIEVQTVVSNLLNGGGDRAIVDFITEANKDHRTLQQQFTKLCLKWIEHCASNEYRTDARNEASHTVCKTMVEAFQSTKGDQSSFSPSEWLPFI